MSSILSWSRKAPYSSVSSIQPDVTGVGEAKRAAWAFAIGERRPTADPPAGRASRRGDLPDVDFARAERVPRRSLWSRIREAFRARSSEATSSEELFELPSVAPAPEANGDNVVPFRRAA